MNKADKLKKATETLEKPGVSAFVRKVCGAGNCHIICVVEGKEGPRMAGKSFYWTTPGGKRVWYPNAYKWPTVYHHSTLCVNVGAEWLLANRNKVQIRRDDGVRMLALPGRKVRVGRITLIPGYVGGYRHLLAIRGKRTYHIHCGYSLEDFPKHAEEYAKKAIQAMDMQDAHARKMRMVRKDIATTRVTIADSRRAGNCTVGTLAFAERRLGVSREEILRRQHLFTVPASRVIACAGSQKQKAMNAVVAAWERETTIAI